MLRVEALWSQGVWSMVHPKRPCTQIVDTLTLKYLNRDCFKVKVYTTWVHGSVYSKPLYRTNPGLSVLKPEFIQAR